MSAEFNPYEAWLGIPRGQQPPSHYQLLGLKNFESEPPTIVEAADDRMELIKPHAAGMHGGNARTVLAEIEAARKTLLSRADKQAYDAALLAYLQGQGPLPSRAVAAQAAATRLPPSAPAAAVPATPAQALAAQRVAAVAASQPAVAVAPMVAQSVQAVAPQAVAVAATPVSAAPMSAAPVLGAPVAAVAVAAQPSPGLPSIGSGRSVASQARLQNYRRRKNSMAGIWLMGGAAVVLIAAVAYAMYAIRQKDQVTAQAKPAAPLPNPAERQYADFGDQRQSNVPPAEVPARTPEENTVARSLGMEGNFAAPGTGYRSNSLVLDADDPEMPATPGDAAMPSDAAPQEATVTADLAALDLGDPSDDERQGVQASLKTARDAIAQREYAKAHESIDLATLLAAHPETIDAVERLRSMLAAVDNFWASARDAVAALEPGEKLTAGSDEFEVLSKDEERLSVRRAGRTINYVIDRVPPELAIVLAQRALSADDPHGKATIGAFLVSDARGDQARGRQLLDEAGKQGADTTLLLAEVDSRGE